MKLSVVVDVTAFGSNFVTRRAADRSETTVHSYPRVQCDAPEDIA
jgi:hypothetical protein